MNHCATAMPCLRVLVFAKAPQPGRAKTRLIPALGAQGAAALAHRMLKHTLAQALDAGIGPVELCMSPAPEDASWQEVEIPAAVQRSAQGEGDLGQRMARAVHRLTSVPGQAVLLLGTDCPSLTAARLLEAAQMLHKHDAVLQPVIDGGYVLIGLKAACPEIFTNMPWSTPAVAALTLERLCGLGMSVWQGRALHDIDESADLKHLPADWLKLLPAL